MCGSTGWLIANIATKYLQVMRYIIRVDTTTRLENCNNINKYHIISIVISRILGLLKDKIKNSNENHELDVDEHIILCHSAIMANLLITQCTLFDWTENEYSR